MSTQSVSTLEPIIQTRPDRPPLQTGDRLSRAEFERRYHAHPEIKKAELIEGVVYVSSPVHHEQHGRPHAKIMTWLGTFRAATAGTDVTDNGTLRLGRNEVQPDAVLRITPEHGGRSRITEDDYLEGSPELVVEIAASSAAHDLHDKKRLYARYHITEYLVVQIYERRIDWFRQHPDTNKYEPLPADDQGIIRSQVFPGLWLDTNAYWGDDWGQMLATLQQGLHSAAHLAFAADLRKLDT